MESSSMNINGWEGMLFIGLSAAIRYTVKFHSIPFYFRKKERKNERTNERTNETELTQDMMVQRARVQRARVRASPCEHVRGDGGAGAVAGLGAAGHGARAGDAGAVPCHLHRRQAPAEGRVQHRLPAGRHHGAQQRPARHLGRRRGRRMAGRRRLHQPRLLLRLRPPARLHLGLPLQIRGQGTSTSTEPCMAMQFCLHASSDLYLYLYCCRASGRACFAGQRCRQPSSAT